MVVAKPATSHTQQPHHNNSSFRRTMPPSRSSAKSVDSNASGSAASATSASTAITDGTDTVRKSSIPTGDDHNATRLRRSWRALASSLVVAARAAEKVAQNGGLDDTKAAKEKKAMDEALEQTLRARADLTRQAALCDAKLRGNAKETEALECSMRSGPSVGVKRKREAEAEAEPKAEFI